jgi:hypothetical protein
VQKKKKKKKNHREIPITSENPKRKEISKPLMSAKEWPKQESVGNDWERM